MRALLRVIGCVLAVLLFAGICVWGALALWFTVPAAEWIRLLLATSLAVLGAGGLIIAFLRRGLLVPIAPFAAAFVGLLAWWSTIEPSNGLVWETDVAVLPSAEVNGDLVTLRNIRNFEYRTEADYTPRYYDKTFDLRNLETLDLIAVYWMGDAIAHTMLSFGFGNDDYVTMSIEIRKTENQAFSTIAGFFRQYQLIYIVGDERDLIGLRTNYRDDPPEEVYLYRVKAKPEKMRSLFLQYAKKIDKLTREPEFYNSATTNCTTNIVMHVEAVNPDWPLSWKMLLSGYFPELIYERGGLDRSLTFAELRRKSLINGRAKAGGISADFSRRIRNGLVGML